MLCQKVHHCIYHCSQCAYFTHEHGETEKSYLFHACLKIYVHTHFKVKQLVIVFDYFHLLTLIFSPWKWKQVILIKWALEWVDSLKKVKKFVLPIWVLSNLVVSLDPYFDIGGILDHFLSDDERISSLEYNLILVEHLNLFDWKRS